MKKFLEGIKYWGQLLLLPIYWFSFLFPRNKNIWLFGSTFGRRFADNPRIDGFAFNQIQNIYTEQKTLDKIQKFLSYS